MGIKNIEDKIIDQVKAQLGFPATPKVRVVETIPGDWDKDMLKLMLRLMPGVFVAFAGGPVKAIGGEAAMIDAHFSVIFGTAHASGEVARRRGDALQIGTYELLELVVPKLHGFKIPDEGTLSLKEVQNLYRGELEKQGVAMYAAVFTMPMALPSDIDVATLSAFLTFRPQYDIPVFETQAERLLWLAENYGTSIPDAKDQVNLPQ